VIDNIKEFEARFPELKIILGRRKSSWTLTTLDWDDVSSILMVRLWQKFHLYEPEKGPLENWANRVISRALSNILRDSLYKWSKPCVTAGPSGGLCVFNLADNGCAYTKSKTKCGECKLYAKWQKKKESLYNIKASLPLDSHSQEVQNLQEDFLDVEAAKKIIDEKMMAQLNLHDAQIYKMLFIDHLSMEEVGKMMKYKTSNNSNVSQVLRKLAVKFKLMAKVIIENEDLT
jgi:RNA polymerase sigma factor (sigma-70 family)